MDAVLKVKLHRVGCEELWPVKAGFGDATVRFDSRFAAWCSCVGASEEDNTLSTCIVCVCVCVCARACVRALRSGQLALMAPR